MNYLGEDGVYDWAEFEEPAFLRARRLKVELVAANDKLKEMKEELYQYKMELEGAEIS